jgi:coenzyme PQQ synthesis protein D (PqqD)
LANRRLSFGTGLAPFVESGSFLSIVSQRAHSKGEYMRYRVNAPHVIAETIGGETIIVHLSTGCYFNLGGTAVDIWEAVAAGNPPEAITRQLVSRYDAGEAEIAAAVSRILEELQREELVVVNDEDGAPGAEAPAAEAGPRAPFQEPTLSKLTDMQDIILLDPVHEVDARGWPHTDPANA